MFQRAAVLEAGGYDASFAPAEDLELWIRLAKRRHGAAVLMDSLVVYRVHDGQQSVTSAERQRANIRRAQAQFVDAYAPQGSGRRVSLILALDSALWTECTSHAQLAQALNDVKALLARLRTSLQLSAGEWGALLRVIDRWLGWGVRMALRWTGGPAAIVYGALCLGSPLLVPRMRGLRSRIARRVRWVRTAVGLVRSLMTRVPPPMKASRT
jgi:hypothetical protein